MLGPFPLPMLGLGRSFVIIHSTVTTLPLLYKVSNLDTDES